ncbi:MULTISPECIES: type-F conjugative transfer system pilin assembly protein TrbC [Sphingomonadales]|uniref:type-F conjugative transfer system pilin assembly protein TrbC n=1 Tax=Novosphingobium sp. SCN 63-17 TaxID=1660120 RepID=UPI00086B2006|nr:type-F conjugative transfer system pilin assembly protein TrbC [Novosphingobium sp. SCN 63-17]ODU80584.1 MAG: conjugal transfer protein TrbC [Novosphingobium sp. SCN 63-17]
MNRKLLLIPLGLAFPLAGLALAQSAPDGIDLDAIRARSAEHAEDAAALAATVRERAEAVHDDALQTQDQAQSAGARYADSLPPTSKNTDVLDFDAMVRERAEAEKAPLGESPRFIAFASLSMPPEALKALVRDMGRAGGVTVLRGFPSGDSARFKALLTEIWQGEDAPQALGIDPRLFRAFHIEAAPSFVMVGSDFSPCDGFNCQDVPPPHDRMTGNVTVGQVLETFKDGAGPGAALARLHLARLEEGEDR